MGFRGERTKDGKITAVIRGRSRDREMERPGGSARARGVRAESGLKSRAVFDCREEVPRMAMAVSSR